MKTLILWLDAFRPDYISKENTPFLFDLKQRYGLTELKPSFGFSQASWFTGCYPNRHGEFFVYNNGEIKVNSWYLRLVPKLLRSHLFNLTRYLKGNDLIAPLMDIKEISNFSITREKNYHHPHKLKTLFDYFRENNLSYLMYYWPLIIENNKTRLTLFTKGNDKSKLQKSINLIRKTNHDVYFFHIAELDAVGHKFGPKSQQINAKLREHDILIEKLVREFNLEKDNVLIWSDHGMIEIKGTINLEEVLPKDDRYKKLIESTMVKFWFYDKDIKKEILQKLKKVKNGHILSDSEKKKLKIDFDTNENYEEVFLANPGYLICPNIWQKQPIKGMHGFDYSQKGELGVLMGNKKFNKKGNMVDMLPTILKLLKLKPREIDGKSLI
ncbi:MAG: alkaline phosphatase family protein [Candidatus Nanoarchaeia archaeon]|nr:alkaline phosphatase family protein [Candidatus Nanoarchaeia archaeon]